ncbi:MAG: hypothetical protein M0Z50_02450 [Planctomycetia bacterium]|nr:hypothetical protein [Planctomycetia bacterium]
MKSQHLITFLFILLGLNATWPAVAVAAPLVVYAQGPNIHVATRGGSSLLDLSPVIWGPHWTWTNLQSSFKARTGGIQTTVTGRMGGTGVPFNLNISAVAIDKRRLRMDLAFSVGRTTDLTLAALAIQAGRSLYGPDRAVVYDAAGQRSAAVPFGRGLLSGTLRKLVLRDGRGRDYTITLSQPTATSVDSEARIGLAAKHLAAADVRHVELMLTLPEDAAFELTPHSVPMPPHWKQWFAWNPQRRPGVPCVFSMASWLSKPAGKYGWITQHGEYLLYHGKPVKLWGVNVSYSDCAPPRTSHTPVTSRWYVAPGRQRARFYARYGINVVRMHKFADGVGWRGICSRQSFVHFNHQALNRMEDFINQLRRRGIYCELSANFGRVRFGPEDAGQIPYANEFPQDHAGWRSTGEGAIWFSRPLQDLQIAQEVNFLKHYNPYTKQRNADTPAIFCVELVNENDALFYTTMTAMQQVPAIKKLAGQEFFAWLKARYHTQKALLAAWGHTSLNAFKGGAGFGGESWSRGIIYPVGNPWFFNPGQLAGAMRAYKERLLDTMHFLYARQYAFYQRYVQALRSIGYKGLIVTSNWQAGSGYANYVNLATDARCGSIIDRHNYFGGSSSMLASPGSAILSSGMQQVTNRPFMLSEWSSVFPNQFGVEGPAIIGAYGMGLNGWDASEMFTMTGNVGFVRKLGGPWAVNTPQVLGVFPAVTREIYRGDVGESRLNLPLYVCIKDLFKGKLGFKDTVDQGYDVKSFSTNKVPTAALAVGRCTVDFTPSYQPTPTVNLAPYRRDGMLHSANGVLAWQPGTSSRSGFITINTPGTQAVVGFAGGQTIHLRDVTIAPTTHFAAIYITALDRRGTIATDHHILITTLARVRNSGMKMIAGCLIALGHAPMRIEPVQVQLTFNRPGTPKVYVLSAVGQRTGRTLPATNGKLLLDGAKTHAIYYEVVY